MLCGIIVVPTVCSRAAWVRFCHAYIFIQDIVVVCWPSAVGANLRMLLNMFYRILHALLQNCVTCNKMLHALNLAKRLYIYIWFNWLSRIYKLLNQTYVLLFGVHIRDLLDKFFCRVTLHSPDLTSLSHVSRGFYHYHEGIINIVMYCNGYPILSKIHYYYFFFNGEFY